MKFFLCVASIVFQDLASAQLGSFSYPQVDVVDDQDDKALDYDANDQAEGFDDDRYSEDTAMDYDDKYYRKHTAYP